MKRKLRRPPPPPMNIFWANTFKLKAKEKYGNAFCTRYPVYMLKLNSFGATWFSRQIITFGSPAPSHLFIVTLQTNAKIELIFKPYRKQH